MVVGIAERGDLVTMQQCVRLRHISDIACGADDRLHQALSDVHADMFLHAKMPVIAFLRLVYFRIALPFFVLPRRRRSNERGVDNGAFTHHQPFVSQMAIDRVEDLPR
jgi:hypothetical protein